MEREILQILNENIKRDLNIQINDKMEDLGIDSIVFIEIIVAIEQKYNFEFDDENLIITSFPYVYSLVDYVKKKYNKS